MHRTLLRSRFPIIPAYPPQPWSLVAALPAGALVLALALALASAPSQADTSQRIQDFWGSGTFGIESCAGVLEGSDNEVSTAADCAADQMLSGLLGVAFQYLDERGDALFGEHFHLDHRLSLSASGGGLSGDLDAVVPLYSFSSISGDVTRRAVFLQNGVTRWKDEHGFQRNDMRLGVVHRIAMSERPDAGVFGTSVFFQENLERGHVRIVSGVEYLGRWGSGSLTWFSPVTDWRPGRSGYEERALEGLEFELRTDLTSTIELRAATGQWKNEEGAEDWSTRGRLGVAWQPHPWFGLQSRWDNIGTAENSLGFHAVLAVPFGGGERQRAPWRGLGLSNLGKGSGITGGDSPVDSTEFWRAVDDIGRIVFVERETTTESNSVQGAQVRFLQTSTQTGAEFTLEVTLLQPASTSTTVTVRLIPGSGDNPAVPGEDYDDTPIEIQINAGSASGTATVRLLQNQDLASSRSLSAQIVS